MSERRWTLSGRAAPTARANRSHGDERERDPMARVPVKEILDDQVLDDLAEDLGPLAADRFAAQYASGLKRRLELLTVATFDHSGYAVYDTAIDLAVAGAMVGAAALAQEAWAVAQDVVRSQTMPQVETLERLMRLAHETEAALARYRRTGSGAPRPN